MRNIGDDHVIFLYGKNKTVEENVFCAFAVGISVFLDGAGATLSEISIRKLQKPVEFCSCFDQLINCGYVVELFEHSRMCCEVDLMWKQETGFKVNVILTFAEVSLEKQGFEVD